MEATREAVTRQLSRSNATTNPTGWVTWLQQGPKTPPLRWFLSGRATILVAVACLPFLLSAALMIWPIMPAVFPFSIVYWVHDNWILPWRGLIFQRFAPVPQIVIMSFLALACLAIFARPLALELYRGAAMLFLRFEPGRRLSAKWTAWKGLDSPLVAQAEAMVLEDAAALITASAPKAARLQRMRLRESLAGELLQSVEVSRRRDLAWTHLVAQAVVADPNQTQILERARRAGMHGAPGTLLARVLLQDTSLAVRERGLSDAWRAAQEAPLDIRQLEEDAVIWTALAHAERSGSYGPVRDFLLSRQRRCFEIDMRAREPSRGGGLDPLIWWQMRALPDRVSGLSRTQLRAFIDEFDGISP